jgi:hypothetical protein
MFLADDAVGKIAVTASGNQDFFPGCGLMVNQRNPSVSFSRFNRAHDSGSACANNDYIKFIHKNNLNY